MLKIIIEEEEIFNEETEEFGVLPSVEVELEHSLLSLSKWESKYKKPFLSSSITKTPEEAFGYLQAMIVTPGLDPDVLYRFSQENIDEVQRYIDSSESATTFGKLPERRGPGEIITSELIYYWMVTCNIPLECENWHLNRLFSLIRIYSIKNSNNKERKLSRHEIAQRNRELNEQRRKELGTHG